MPFSRRLLFRIVIGCGALGPALGSFLGLRMTESAHAQSSVAVVQTGDSHRPWMHLKHALKLRPETSINFGCWSTMR